VACTLNWLLSVPVFNSAFFPGFHPNHTNKNCDTSNDKLRLLTCGEFLYEHSVQLGFIYIANVIIIQMSTQGTSKIVQFKPITI